MQILGLLSLVVQVYFAVHAGRTGRFGWIFLIIFFPMIGSLVYFFVEYLPEMQDASKIRKSRNHNPAKNIKQLKRQVEITDTIQNRIDLAEACFLDKNYQESISLLESCLVGIFNDDPHVLEGLFYSYFSIKDYENALHYLERREKIADKRISNDVKLVKARMFEDLGKLEESLLIYESIINTGGEEAKCRYALLLSKTGKKEQAREIFEEIIRKSKIHPKQYKKFHKKWVNIAKNELKKDV